MQIRHKEDDPKKKVGVFYDTSTFFLGYLDISNRNQIVLQIAGLHQSLVSLSAQFFFHIFPEGAELVEQLGVAVDRRFVVGLQLLVEFQQLVSPGFPRKFFSGLVFHS